MDFVALGGAVVLVLINGFFVAIEFALVKVRPSQLQAMVEQGSTGAGAILKMRRKLDTYLSGAQAGITLASLALGWVGEPAFAHLLEPLIGRFAPPDADAQKIAHTIGLVMAFAAITFLHIIVGEQVPKMLAIAKPTTVALALGWPMRVFQFFAFPLVWVINVSTRGFSRLLGLRHQGEGHEALGEEELSFALASSVQAGMIASERAELLQRALSMVEKTARQVLSPRTQMRFLDLEEPLEKQISDARVAGHTWLPVVRGNLDQVEGVINVKDMFFLLSKGELKSLAQIQRPVLFVPENATLEQLLSEFRRRKRQLAVVVDEHGGTSGIVSIADVVGELVGDIAELGRQGEQVTKLPGGKLELPGTAQLDDLEHTLETKFDVEEGEVTTIGGYLMSKLGRVPSAGDSWTLEDWEIRVLKVDGPRVLTVRIEPKEALRTPGAPSSPEPARRPS
jgi:CBS domain containing-hemolysin-like protein